MTRTPATAAAEAPAATGPRLWREPDHQVLGGVCSGLAVHLGLPTRRARWALRAAFVLAALAGGLGAVLYVAYWIVVPLRPGAEERGGRARLVRAAAVIVAAVVLAVTVLRTSGSGTLLVPVVLAVVGGALVWRQAGEDDRERWRRLSRGPVRGERLGAARLAGGVALILVGGILVIARYSTLTDLRNTVTVIVVVTLGLALISGPYWMRAATTLADERRARIRAQEREDIAAHLHDSVLQTLALIQRNAASPREVLRLARGQERELRTMLYGERPDGTFAAALHTAVGEIEDGYGLSVDEVVVGDRPLDDDTWALVQATREAMANAGKHAGVGAVSVYAEVDEEIAVYVRDRGRGFDPAAVPADRQGVRGSLIGRMERHGGRAVIRSEPGTGTEVELHLPITEGQS